MRTLAVAEALPEQPLGPAVALTCSVKFAAAQPLFSCGQRYATRAGLGTAGRKETWQATGDVLRGAHAATLRRIEGTQGHDVMLVHDPQVLLAHSIRALTVLQ